MKQLFNYTLLCWKAFMFMNFADQLALTVGEWELLFNFLVPTLTQIRE